ncbi:MULTISPECIES: hypothetical protein [Aphanothece]|uniref:hypothetical protein n=1 Tax=Aphanothece TaxID=1121 RepID=UPI0039848865
MSYLRDIMERLGASRDGAASGTSARDAGEPQLLEAAPYRHHLDHCSEPMLLYEWTWLELHLEDLRLCRANDEMRKVAGGSRHLEALIAAAERNQEQLAAVFAERGLTPRRLPHSVAAGEHAWELSNAQLRAQWGLPGSTP